MEKKKGFTLVEILVVIAILSILVLLALPSVIKVYNNARKDSFVVEAKTLGNSTSKNFLQKYLLSGGNKGYVTSEDETAMDINKTDDLKYYFLLDKKGKVINYVVSSNLYCIKSNKNFVELDREDVMDEPCDITWYVDNSTYTINHYTRNLDNEEYTLRDTNLKVEGALNANITAPTETFSGFTSPENQVIRINRDGSTVVNYYYERNSYDLVLKTGTGISKVNGAGKYKFEEKVLIQSALKTGYKFVNWTGFLTKTKKDENIYMPVVNATDSLTANAEAIKYTITYEKNNATDGSMTNSIYTYDQAKALTTNTYTRLGYDFKGWSLTDTGAVKYTNGQSVNNLTTIDGQVIKLYAVWSQNKYAITYNYDGGVKGASNPANSLTNTIINISKPTRTGYTFTGWTITGSLNTSAAKYGLTNITVTNGITSTTQKVNAEYFNNLSTGNTSVTLTANWQANNYTVVYNGNGATSGSMSNSIYTYGESKALATNSFEKTDNNFLGWSTSSSGTVNYTNGQTVGNLTTTNNATITLFAVWEKRIIKTTELVTGIYCNNMRNSSASYYFYYTGNCALVQENSINWQIKLLSSGTLTTSNNMYLDMFLVSGGNNGASGACTYDGTYQYCVMGAGGAGGSGGKYINYYNRVLSSGSYNVVIGGAGVASSLGSYTSRNGNTAGSGGSGGAAECFGYGCAIAYAGSGGTAGIYAFNATSGTMFSAGGGGGGGVADGNWGRGYWFNSSQPGGAAGGPTAGAGGHADNPGLNATANTGSGGGGAGGRNSTGGIGGSGIIIIRNAR